MLMKESELCDVENAFCVTEMCAITHNMLTRMTQICDLQEDVEVEEGRGV